MKRITIFFLAFCFTLLTSAEVIKGIVTDSNGETLPGASVLLKGTTLGVMTNINGEFSIELPKITKRILIISFVGFRTKEVSVTSNKILTIVLDNSTVQLDEVVAVGYGTTKRKDLTGSVVSVRAEDLQKVPTSNIGQALAGRVAGVQVTQSEGAPGASISVRVRGGISITQSNEPLYVVDGFPMDDALNTIDPADIETIDIMKDASSTAIYGSRGANGVVVITTKSGSKSDGRLAFSYDTYVGVRQVSKWLEVLNPEEFVFLDYERRKGDPAKITAFEGLYGKATDIAQNYSNRAPVDWQREMLGKDAFTQNHRLSIGGGNKDLKYNMSYSFFDDMGFIPNSGFSKNNFKFRLDHNVTKKFSISANISYDENTITGIGTSENGANFNKMNHILQYRPIGGLNFTEKQLLEGEDPLLMDEQGNTMQNPLISAKEEKSLNKTRTFQTGFNLSYNFSKYFSFKTLVGLRYQTRRTESFMGERSMTAIRNNSISGSIRNDEFGSLQTSNILQYDREIKKNKFTAMIGQEFVTRWTQWFQASGEKFPNNDIGLNNMGLAEIAGKPQSFVNRDDKLVSFFGRFNYSFTTRYLLSMSFRADGSSKFGANNKWGYFPSISGAWRIGEEKLVKKLDIFSDLKLRMGVGLAGNNRINSYLSLPVISSVTYPVGDINATGYASTQIPNANLKWESNRTLNVGLDMGFWNQRLTISPEVYFNRSNNLLLDTKIPFSSGFTSMMQNIGITENRGVDLTISTVNISTNNFKWTTNLNISHNKNMVIALSGEQKFLTEAVFGFNQKNYVVEVGKPLGLMYGFKTLGLYQVDDFDYNSTTGAYTIKKDIPYDAKNTPQPGHWKFANIDNSDNMITDNDRTIIGDANPDFYGGMNNTFTFRNIDFSVFVNFCYGNDVLNATKMYNYLGGRDNKNALNIINSSNRWISFDKQTGAKVTDPDALRLLNAGKALPAVTDLESGDLYVQSWGVEDGSFLRINNVTLGYTFSKKLLQRLNIQKLRIYSTVNNLHLFTKYSGFDPEVSTRGNGLTPGVDWGAYPRSISFVFGLNLNF